MKELEERLAPMLAKYGWTIRNNCYINSLGVECGHVFITGVRYTITNAQGSVLIRGNASVVKALETVLTGFYYCKEVANG